MLSRQTQKKTYKIISYSSKYRSQVEQIHLDTALLGKSIAPFLDNTKRKSLEIKYYLDKEPQSCFIVIDENKKCVGYLLGCLDDKNNRESFATYILPIYGRVLLLPFMQKKDRAYYGDQIKIMTRVIVGLSQEKKFRTPSPAGHLHINLLPEARGKGLGTKLLKTFFKYAKSQGVKTIHADSFQTRVNPNKNFWMKNGFEEYCKVKTSIFKKYYPNEEIYLVCYVKEL